MKGNFWISLQHRRHFFCKFYNFLLLVFSKKVYYVTNKYFYRFLTTGFLLSLGILESFNQILGAARPKSLRSNSLKHWCLPWKGLHRYFILGTKKLQRELSRFPLSIGEKCLNTVKLTSYHYTSWQQGDACRRNFYGHTNSFRCYDTQ